MLKAVTNIAVSIQVFMIPDTFFHPMLMDKLRFCIWESAGCLVTVIKIDRPTRLNLVAGF